MRHNIQRATVCGIVFAVAFSFVTCFDHPASAQGAKGKQNTKSKKQDDEEELPEMETLTLQTKDGVSLSVNYLASNNAKKAPAVILVHDWDGSSRDFLDDEGIAKDFQKRGYAVIVPDLRGHGKSTTRGEKELDTKKFKRRDFELMMEDIETCKRYLKEQNNEGKLNIELLSILAVGKSSVLAINWSITDWSFPPFKGKKQGQDVKSIILLSPEKSWKGLSITKSIKAPVISGKSGKALPMFVLTGDGNASLARQTKELKRLLERSRGEELAKESLTITVGKTKIQGAEFTGSPKARDMIHQFIELHILSKAADMRWQNRAKDQN